MALMAHLACASRLIFSRPCIGIISRQTVASPGSIPVQSNNIYSRMCPREQQLFHDTRARLCSGCALVLSRYVLTYPRCGESLPALRREWGLFKGTHEQSHPVTARAPRVKEAVSREQQSYFDGIIVDSSRCRTIFSSPILRVLLI